MYITSMKQLPLEIVEEILTDKKLSIEDVLNFSMTCRLYRDLICSSVIIWKKKFIQKWPQFLELFSSDFTDWYEEVRYIHALKRKTRELLETMSPRFYKRYELSDSDLVEWAELLKERPQTYNYLVYDLINIVNTHLPIKSIEIVPITTPGNKTLQYYAIKVLRFLRQLCLSREWVEYTSLPQKLQILERGAVFVAQWCQPHIEVTWRDIASKIDDLAEKVKAHLKLVNPSHPIFATPEAQLKCWKVENLDRNQWNAVHCNQIILSMRVVLYQQLGFCGNNSAYYMPENSFINEVLDKKRGLPITLTVLYESIARRLGLKCEPISFPAHFLLRFTEGIEINGDSYYIDVFNNGDIIRRGSCPHSQMGNQNREPFPVATAQQVVERMANNLELSGRQHTHPNGRITRLRSSLELLQLVNPHDISARVSLARLYMLHNMDTKPMIALLLSQEFTVPEQAQRIVHMLEDYEAQRKRNDEELFTKVEAALRSANLKYAVGMVMKHLTLNYKCVIYDWDPVCLASLEWQAQMSVNKLSLKDDQPFYNVLVEDGSHRYVAQENLEPTSDTGFLYLIEDIGRHFSHFFETHYVPNAEKEKEYPADKRVRHMFYQKMKFGDMKL